MTIKLTHAQAKHIQALKSGMRTVPPLKDDVMQTLVQKGLVVKVDTPAGLRQEFYELTLEGKLY